MLVKELFLKGITPTSYFLKYPQISLCSMWSLIVIFFFNSKDLISCINSSLYEEIL